MMAAGPSKNGEPTATSNGAVFVRLAARPILAAPVVFSHVVPDDADAAVGEKGEKAKDDGLQTPPCCGREDCRERANEGCRKKLACGHPCRGPGERQIIPNACNKCVNTPCAAVPGMAHEAMHSSSLYSDELFYHSSFNTWNNSRVCYSQYE